MIPQKGLMKNRPESGVKMNDFFFFFFISFLWDLSHDSMNSIKSVASMFITLFYTSLTLKVAIRGGILLKNATQLHQGGLPGKPAFPWRLHHKAGWARARGGAGRGANRARAPFLWSTPFFVMTVEVGRTRVESNLTLEYSTSFYKSPRQTTFATT